jgi:hypothetical protein
MSLSLSASRLVAAVTAALALAVLSGCGGSKKTVTVSGKVVMPKVKLMDTDSITVTFTPEDNPTAPGGTSSVSPKDLAFSVNVAPGKYKVAVTVQGYPGEKGSDKRDSEFANYFGKYGTGVTPLRYEVTSDPNQSITIDLAKGAISN